MVRELTIDRLRYELARVARYQTFTKDKDAETWKGKPAHPPIAVCKNILATPNPPFPALTRVVEVPVFAPDGTLQTEPGYVPACRVYYAPDPAFRLPVFRTDQPRTTWSAPAF